MNVESVKSFIEKYGKRVSGPCWEIDNKKNRDKSYVWIIERPFGSKFQPFSITTNINVKQEFSIHYTGAYDPVQGYFASFVFRTDTPMNGVISKITLILRKHSANEASNETCSAVSDWMNCKSGSKYCYFSNEQWRLLVPFLLPNFDLNVPYRVGTNYKECIIVIIEFINTSSIITPPAISKEQEHQNAALQFNSSKLYESKDFADVQLVVNGSELMAHKNILAVGSPVFKTMMETNMVEKNSSKIEIEDFEPEIIEEMLKYIYTGKVDLVGHAEQLLKCSDKYDIQGLMDLCQNYLGKNISAVGFVKIFELLQLYGERVPILKKSAEEHFKMNENSVSESEEFHNALQLYPISNELADLYNSKKRKREEE